MYCQSVTFYLYIYIIRCTHTFTYCCDIHVYNLDCKLYITLVKCVDMLIRLWRVSWMSKRMPDSCRVMELDLISVKYNFTNHNAWTLYMDFWNSSFSDLKVARLFNYMAARIWWCSPDAWNLLRTWSFGDIIHGAYVSDRHVWNNGMDTWLCHKHRYNWVQNSVAFYDHVGTTKVQFSNNLYSVQYLKNPYHSSTLRYFYSIYIFLRNI